MDILTFKTVMSLEDAGFPSGKKYPSLAGILREIPHLRLYFDGEEWVVCEFDRNKNEEIVIARHANAAEAAAKAYLFLNLNEE